MKRIALLLREVELVRHVLPAVFFGASLGLFVHGYWLIDLFPVDSKSLLFYTLVVCLIGIAGYILLFRWVTIALQGTSTLQKAGIIGVSLLAGAFLFFTVTGNWQKPARYISLFLPTHTLEITVPPGQNADSISIFWMTTSFGYTSYDTIDYQGWELKKDRLVLTNPSDNYLRWVGKTGDVAQIAFESPTPNGKFLLSWDGQEETLKFSRKKISYEHAFDVPLYISSSGTLLLGILNFALLALPLCVLVWMKREEMLPAIHRGFTPISHRLNVREWIAILAVVILALALRVPNLGILFPSVEEYSHINAAKQIIQGAPVESVYQRGMWLVTVPVSLLFRLFGYELWIARLLGVFFNALAVIPLYLLARKINRPVATLSILLFATSPWMIAVSRVVREYAYHPFFFFWIIYGMVLVLEQIPDRFHIDRDWKAFLNPQVLLVGVALAIPPYYALNIDRLSTFKLILMAYAVFGLFLILKIDLRYVKNWIVLLAIAGIALRIAYYLHKRYPVGMTLNLDPLRYFFQNPPQQWYFDRVFMIPLIGLPGVIAAGMLVYRINKAPLFTAGLFVGFLGFFMLSSSRFFAPRHLSTTELWYIILIAISFYVLWIFLQTFPVLQEKWTRVLTVIVLAGIIINIQQVFVPMTSRTPAMPITEDYHNDLTDLQSFMLANVRQGDVLVSSRIYSRYVEWVDEPVFQKIIDFQVQSTEADVLSVVDQYDSGWIIIDNARIERATFSPDTSFLDNDRIEYVGLFDDEHVWRWRAK